MIQGRPRRQDQAETLAGANRDVTTGELKRIYDRGVAAANRGEFGIAVRLWQRVAEQGHVKAQYNLGVAYARGIGVPQDKAVALTWWDLAARQGHAEAERQARLLRAKRFEIERPFTRFGVAMESAVKATVRWLRRVASAIRRD
ncbi:MAG TPA: tetratricopeptide repeat protein [Reyranella sp.]|nr:tetratricopeptide repeat protein [Reyranella sp.]